MFWRITVPFICTVNESRNRSRMGNGCGWWGWWIQRMCGKPHHLLPWLLFLDCLTLWRQRNYDPSKHQKLCTQKLSIISYKAWIFTNTTMRTSNLPAATMLSAELLRSSARISACETAIKSHNYCCCCLLLLFVFTYFSYEESSWENKSLVAKLRLKK